MNWNNNDTKYIIKRILLYLIITSIVFFVGQRCAKAMIVDSTSFLGSGNYTIPNGTSNIYIGGANNNKFRGKGTGYVTFTMMYGNDSNSGNWPIKYVELEQYDYNGLSGIYNCDIGNFSSYNDNGTWFYITNVTCPVNLTGNNGIGRLAIQRTSNSGNLQLFFSAMMNFIADSGNGSSDIINAQQTATGQILSSQAGIDNAINTYGQQAHNDAQAVATAIQNQSNEIIANTQAIDNLNDTIQADLDPTIPTDFMDGIDGLFTNTDDNVIRQLLMLPLNLFVIVYNALTSNSCSAISLGSLYGVNLSLPCIDWKNYVGSGFYIIIDTIFGSVLTFGLYRYAKHVLNSAFNLSDKATEAVEVFK